MPKRQIYITDIIIEVAIPVLVIGLIWTLVTFAINIKGVFYPGQEPTLIFVFFCYVVGTVMVNRIAGYYGESGKAAAYSILLVGVMALFAMMFSARYGSIFGGANAGEGLWANLAMVAVVGFASYKLARESCFDITETTGGKSTIQLRSELKAQQDWYRREEMEEERAAKEMKEEDKPPGDEAREPARLPKKHPGVWTIYYTLFSMIVFAVGQRFLPVEDFEIYARAFSFLAANLICALALLLLVSLSALRAHAWDKKAVIPPGVGWFWILGGAALILVVVSLATLPPRPVPEYLARTAAEEDVSTTYGAGEEGMKVGSNRDWGALTKLEEMKLAKWDRDHAKLGEKQKEFWGDEKDQTAEPGEEGETGEEKDEDTGGPGLTGTQTSGESPQDQAGSGGGKSEQTASGKGGSQKGSQQSKSTRSTPPRAAPKRPPLPRPPMQGLQTLGKVVFIMILVVGALWAFAMLLRALGRANPLKKVTAGFKNLAARLRGLFSAARLPRLSRKGLRAVLEEEDLYMENPFRNHVLLKQMTTADLVSYTYRAFENYSHAQGHTPSRGQTPMEFVKSLPDDFRAAEFSALVRLFMLAEYSSHRVPDKSVKKLQHVWEKIET